MKMNRLVAILTIINLTILILILVQGRMVTTPATSDVLRVRAIELVDERDQVRAQLNVEPGGEVVFRLRCQDRVGKSSFHRVKLGASEEGSGLLLLNELTEPGIHLLVDPSETYITLTEQGGAKQEIKP